MLVRVYWLNAAFPISLSDRVRSFSRWLCKTRNINAALISNTLFFFFLTSFNPLSMMIVIRPHDRLCNRYTPIQALIARKISISVHNRVRCNSRYWSTCYNPMDSLLSFPLCLFWSRGCHGFKRSHSNRRLFFKQNKKLFHWSKVKLKVEV